MVDPLTEQSLIEVYYVPHNAIYVQVNGHLVNFTSSDGNPNSYLSLFPNVNNKSPSGLSFALDFGLQLINAMQMPAGHLPANFFMFLEMQWGGGGCFEQAGAGKSWGNIIGCAVGLR